MSPWCSQAKPLCEPAAFNSHDSTGPISIVPGQLQEESAKVWKELFTKLGSPEELQAKLESNDTPMVRALGEEFIRTKVLPKTQLKRLIKPEEIADAICFMLTNATVSGELWADAGWRPAR